MLKDQLGQEIKVGTILIRPELYNKAARFRVVKVVELTDKSFKYVTLLPRKNAQVRLCRMANCCLVVPEIIMNYWSILEG
jgi:hypothetical protein